MKLNQNLETTLFPLGSNTLLSIDNFFDDPAEILKKENFEFNYDGEPLLPFPLGVRTRLDIGQDVIDLVNKQYNTKYTKASADLILTTWEDIENYESNYLKNDGEEHGESFISDLRKDDFLEQFTNNHPARPIFDWKCRHVAYCFMQDYTIDKALEKVPEHKKTRLEFFKSQDFLFATQNVSIEESEDLYEYSENLPVVKKQKLAYNIHINSYLTENHQNTDTERAAYPAIDDNFNKQHSSITFKNIYSIKNKFNRTVIFPGNCFHQISVCRTGLYPQLMMAILFDN